MAGALGPAGSAHRTEDVLAATVVTVRSEHVSRASARWDVLLGRVISGARGNELWGPVAIFEAVEEDELVAEVQRLSAEHSIPPRAVSGSALRSSCASRRRAAKRSRAFRVDEHVVGLKLPACVSVDDGRIGLGTFEPIPAEIRRAVLAGFAQSRNLSILDESDPRFDGLTPREAARSVRQRSRLERWLRRLENSAARGRAPDGFAPDVALIRRELAIPDDTLADAA